LDRARFEDAKNRFVSAASALLEANADPIPIYSADMGEPQFLALEPRSVKEAIHFIDAMIGQGYLLTVRVSVSTVSVENQVLVWEFDEERARPKFPSFSGPITHELLWHGFRTEE